ncbi:chitosanase [Streptomyces sp. AK02-01A]|uniref:chitosanase n=1 Tax=Streptomyces sp. AK02-01A TaxID=3028648 RepID=UPI0029A8E6A8|nr:chitosanase [Streptomyces sp. AK02-01A]MDX3855582.1 chitosanase [Streptomyces sp. AK02-01A]
MKPVTRLFLIGAPIVVAVAVIFGGGDDSGVLADHPPAYPGQSGAPNPLASGEPDDQAALEKRIDKMPPGLAAPAKKEIAARLVASAENSTLDWRGQYGAIEDIGDGNGYTAGVIGFCSGTNDMLQLVESYTKSHPDNPLASYLPALREVDGTDSHEGLDPGFRDAWAEAAESPDFREAQDRTRDRIYFDPAVRLAKMDGLGTLGQFVYYDAMVLHGPGLDAEGFYGIRQAAMKKAKPTAEGGDEKTYLNAFLDQSRSVMKAKLITTQRDSSRIDTAQRVFLRDGNMNLDPPLTWQMYGETFRIDGR